MLVVEVLGLEYNNNEGSNFLFTSHFDDEDGCFG